MQKDLSVANLKTNHKLQSLGQNTRLLPTKTKLYTENQNLSRYHFRIPRHQRRG